MGRQKYGMAPESDYSWYAMLDQFMEIKACTGMNPRSHGGSKEETRLYYWMYNQTRLILNGNMSAKHYMALVRAGADIPNRGNLYEKYIKNVETLKKMKDEGTYPEPSSSLDQWLRKQFLPDTVLCDWQDEALSEAGFSIENCSNSNRKWMQMFDAFQNSPSQKTTVWIRKQLDFLKKGLLEDWKKKKLSQIGIDENYVPVVVNAHSKAFDNKITSYMEFVKEHGHKPKSKLAKSQEEWLLNQWATGERRNVKKGKRTEQQIMQLKELGIVA